MCDINNLLNKIRQKNHRFLKDGGKEIFSQNLFFQWQVLNKVLGKCYSHLKSPCSKDSTFEVLKLSTSFWCRPTSSEFNFDEGKATALQSTVPAGSNKITA